MTQRGEPRMSGRYECLAIMDIYAHPTPPPNLTWRITMALNMAFTTCRLPQQTIGKGDIQT